MRGGAALHGAPPSWRQQKIVPQETVVVKDKAKTELPPSHRPQYLNDKVGEAASLQHNLGERAQCLSLSCVQAGQTSDTTRDT